MLVTSMMSVLNLVLLYFSLVLSFVSFFFFLFLSLLLFLPLFLLHSFFFFGQEEEPGGQSFALEGISSSMYNRMLNAAFYVFS